MTNNEFEPLGVAGEDSLTTVPTPPEVPTANLLRQPTFQDVTPEARQALGGYGYSEHFSPRTFEANPNYGERLPGPVSFAEAQARAMMTAAIADATGTPTPDDRPTATLADSIRRRVRVPGRGSRAATSNAVAGGGAGGGSMPPGGAGGGGGGGLSPLVGVAFTTDIGSDATREQNIGEWISQVPIGERATDPRGGHFIWTGGLDNERNQLWMASGDGSVIVIEASSPCTGWTSDGYSYSLVAQQLATSLIHSAKQAHDANIERGRAQQELADVRADVAKLNELANDKAREMGYCGDWEDLLERANAELRHIELRGRERTYTVNVCGRLEYDFTMPITASSPERAQHRLGEIAPETIAEHMHRQCEAREANRTRFVAVSVERD